MTIFWSSDTHYFHKNIISYSNRPFKDVDEMNEKLIANWNSVVTNNDTVYHLGDVSFADKEKTDKILNRLNGQIMLVKGNHDNRLVSDRFEWVKDYFELKVQDKDTKKGSQLIVMSHYPFATWNGSYRGSVSVHGHTHNNLKKDYNLLRMDIGVDACNFFPISYEQIKQEFKKNYNLPTKDHHNNEINP